MTVSLPCRSFNRLCSGGKCSRSNWPFACNLHTERTVVSLMLAAAEGIILRETYFKKTFFLRKFFSFKKLRLLTTFSYGVSILSWLGFCLVQWLKNVQHCQMVTHSPSIHCKQLCVSCSVQMCVNRFLSFRDQQYSSSGQGLSDSNLQGLFSDTCTMLQSGGWLYSFSVLFWGNP